MSYLVLARKWRPKQFDEVVGQKTITQTLKNSIISGRIAHAYLFSGQRGIGKTTTARILAKALNCEEGPTPKPCDNCSLCNEINRGSSIDVIEIDGASNNSVDDIRDLREKVHYIPARGRYKVYIIDEVHMLSKPAFNALLKTLEEPPEHVVFILATTEAHKIPITILSRCQRYDFRRIAPQEMFAYLEKLVEAEGGLKGEKEAILRLIAKTADGSLRDALSLIDQLISIDDDGATLQQVLDLVSLVDYHIIGEMMMAVAEGKTRESLMAIEKVIDRGHDLKHFVEQTLRYIRDAIIFKIAEGDLSMPEVDGEEAKEIAKLVESVSQQDLLRYFEILAKTIEKMRFSSQPRLILEMALIRLAEIPKLASLENLIQRLEILGKTGPESKGKLPGSGWAPSPMISGNEGIPKPQKPDPPIQDVTPEALHDAKEDTPATPPIPSEQLEQNGLDWTGVINQVKAESMVFGSVLEHLKVEHQEESNIFELALQEENPFYWKLIEDKTNQSLLHKTLEKMRCNHIQIKWVNRKKQGTGKAKKNMDAKKNKGSSSGSTVERSLDLLNKEPIIQRAMDIFSAQIVETRIAEADKNKQSEGNVP